MNVELKVTRQGDCVNYPKAGDKVTIHYIGKLDNGKVFDSSLDRGEPFVTMIGIGKVIKGWDEGVLKMSLGEKAILLITASYGYGARGFTTLIPPHSDLVFEVELLAINDKKAENFPERPGQLA